MPSRPTMVYGSRQTAGRGHLTPPASARHTPLTRFKQDETTVPTPVHVTVDGDRDYLGDHPETRESREDIPRSAATRTRKRWPFVLPPGWTWHRKSRPTEPGQSPHDEECPR